MQFLEFIFYFIAVTYTRNAPLFQIYMQTYLPQHFYRQQRHEFAFQLFDRYVSPALDSFLSSVRSSKLCVHYQYISNKMLSCDLESIVFLKPSKVQQSENQESKQLDNKWLRSRRNHGYVLYDTTTTLHSTRSKIAKLPKCCVLKKF